MFEPQNKFLRNRIIILLSLLFSVTAGGTLGYRYLEHWPWLDAFYMTIITLTTVGFGETQPLSPAGRLFTIVLIAGGAGVVAYASSTLVQLLISGDLQKQLKLNRRQKMLQKLQNHYIICGLGRMGRHVALDLQNQGSPFVMIDIDEKVIDRCTELGYICLLGNAANHTTLEKAGIERAKCLIATAPSDAENVFIVLTAREMCPDLIIVSRMNFDDSESKLLRAGANEVVSPYAIGGRRMVTYVQRPGVVDFLDVVLHSQELELQLEEFMVNEASKLAGQSLQEAQLRSQIGVNIVALRAPHQPLSTNPSPNCVLEPGTYIIALGTSQQLALLAQQVQRTS